MRKHFLILMLMALLPLAGWAADGDITDPTPKAGATALTFTGSAQELLSDPGSVEGVNYELRYAVVTSETATPAWSDFSTAAPKGTNAGTYFVFFASYNTVTQAHSTIGPKVSAVIKKKALAAGTDYTAPTEIVGGITYDGTAQALVNAGGVTAAQAVRAGTLTYKVDNGSYGTAVPTATNVKRNTAGVVQNYVVKYKLSGSANYEEYEGTINVPIQPLDIDATWITFVPGAATRTYGGNWAAPTVTVTPYSAAEIPVTTQIKWYTNAVCDEGETTNPQDATTFYAKVFGTGNFGGSVAYDATDRPTWKFSVEKKQVRLLVNPQSKVYNGAEQTPDAAASNFTAYGLTDADEALGITGLQVQKVTSTDVIKNVGKYFLRAKDIDGDVKIGTGTSAVLLSKNYTPVYLEQGYIEITKKPLTVSVIADKEIAYGDALPATKALYEGSADTDYAALVTITGNVAADLTNIKKALSLGLKVQYDENGDPIAVGDYYNHKDEYAGCWAISYTADANGDPTDETLKNYSFTPANKKFTITGAGFTIMAVYASKEYDGLSASNANLSYIALDENNDPVTIPSNVAVVYEYLTNAATDTWSTTLPTAVGTYKYRVKANDAYATGNYDAIKIEYEPANLKINPKTINISVDALTLHTGDNVAKLNQYASYTIDENTPLVEQEKLNVYYEFDETALGANWDGTNKKLQGTNDNIPAAISVRLVTADDYEAGGIYAGQTPDLKNNGNYVLTVTKGALKISAGTVLALDEDDIHLVEKLADANNKDANVDVTFTKDRIFRANKWYAIVLPFETTVRAFSTAMGYATVDVLDATKSTASFVQHVGKIEANTPFIFKVDEDINLKAKVQNIDPTTQEETWTGAAVTFNTGTKKIDFTTNINEDKNAEITFGGGTLIGTYTETGAWGTNQYYMSTNTNPVQDWVNPASKYTEQNPRMISPFRAILKFNAPAPGARIFIEEPDGSTTAIGAIAADGELVPAEGWYTLNGVKLQGIPTQKGIYINNGKKVVVK